MDWMRSWILGLTAASLLTAAVKVLTPEGGVKRVTEFVCGVMLCAVLLSPLGEADRDVFSAALAEYRRTAAELTEDVEGQEKELMRTFIQDRSAAYIVDEARRLGLPEIRASVRVKWGDECWVPWEAAIRGTLTAGERQKLSAVLEAELGIPGERQEWDEDG